MIPTTQNPSPASGVPSTPDASLAGEQYSLFRRHEQLFCIDATYLQEVLLQSRVTPVPRAPQALAGVMNLRGEVLPVVMLDYWLRLPEQPYDPARPVLVLRRKDLLLGLQVDSVQRVGYVPRSEVLASPLSTQSSIWAGIWYRADQDLATMLDGGSLLDAIHAHMTKPAQAESQETAVNT